MTKLILNRIFLSCCLLTFLLTSCDTGTSTQTTASDNSYGNIDRERTVEEKPPVETFEFKAFDRQSNIDRINRKIEKKQPLVVHLLVPLCDNDHQGIVKVNERLGNGTNLKSNLYWGAMYGIKSHFKRSKDWKLLKSIEKVNKDVLERVVFLKTFPNGAKVYLVADAYRGDKMKPCVNDFLSAVAGKKIDELSIESEGENHNLALFSEADFIAFNGHNGLMDFELNYMPNEDGLKKDVAVIGCASFEYFKNHLNIAKGYPLLTTNGLMAPEAYIVEAVVNEWAINKTDSDFQLAAGKAYNQYQKCGIKGATRLFKSGW